MFHSRSDYRSFRNQKRYSLPLHVCSHKCSVCIVVFKEGYHSGSHGHYLLWRYVHVIYIVSILKVYFAVYAPRRNLFIYKFTLAVKRFICLGYDYFFFLVCRYILYLVRYFALAFFYNPIWSFDKSVFVDYRIGGERTYKADVWPFRRFYRTHSPVMRIVNVPHLKSGSVPRQSPGPQC